MTHTAVLAAARRFDLAGAALLERALDPLTRSVWPDVAWRFSELTVDGCPVELGFSTHDSMLRATLEVAGPECPNTERLDAALRLLAHLDLPLPAPERVAAWRTMQAGHTLRWGCWLGLRVSAAGPRGKLYVEVPARYRSRVSAMEPAMLGYDPATGITEHYGPLASPTEASLAHLFGIQAGPVLDALAELTEMPLAIALGWVRIWYSVATGPGIAPRQALFFRAHAVKGGAARLRRKFSNNAGYQALFGAVSDHALPDHSALTLAPDDRGGVELRAAISPMALAG